MPIYDYTAIDDYGKKIEGQCEAQGEKDLEEILSQRGLYLLEAKEKYAIAKSQKVEVVSPTPTPDSYNYRKEVQGAREIHFHQHIYNVPEAPKPWSDFTIWTLLWLIFFFPVGLFLLWQKKYTPKWFKITISAIAGLYGLLYLPFANTPSTAPVVPNYIQSNMPADSPSFNKTGYLEGYEPGGGIVIVYRESILTEQRAVLAQNTKFVVPNHTKAEIVSSSFPFLRIKIKEGQHTGEEGYVLTDWYKE